MTPYYDEAITDIADGLRLVDMWGRLGWAEIKRRYRRTFFGPFWSSLSLTVFVVTMGFIWSTLWKIDTKEYLPYLCSGMMVWVMIAAFITEGSLVFVAAEGLIKQLHISYMMLICAMIWRNLIMFAHNLLVYVPIFIYSAVPVNGYVLFVIPGLAAVCINGAWIALVLGLLVARYRDVQQIVATLLQVSMFVTPVFWSPDQLKGPARILVDYNILYHYVEIVRDPLLGRPPTVWSWFMVILASILGWAFALYLFSCFRRRIAYWL